MGWIKLDRKLLEHWVWQAKPFSQGQAWIDLLLLANHEDKKFMSGQSLVHGKRGDIYKSIVFFSERWGWERKKVKRFLDALEADRMAVVNATTHGTTITLINYGKYQSARTTKRPTEGQPMDNSVLTEGQQLPTYKNIKNNKKNKEGKEGGSAAVCPPGKPDPGFVDPVEEYYRKMGDLE